METEKAQGSDSRSGLFLRALPIILFLSLAVLLWMGLGGDPQYLPSALVGEKLPEFSLETVHDAEKTLQTKDFLGEPFLINVWATWCPSCRVEHGTLLRLAQAGVPIVGLNYKDERSLAISYLARYKDPFKWSIYDEVGSVGFDLGVYGAPETFFVNPDGIVQHRHVGVITDDVWDNELASIFNAMGGSVPHFGTTVGVDK
jgi:cytochrome c biogenesis protein CcmG/thiol:disulfide interchange protein DsbE